MFYISYLQTHLGPAPPLPTAPLLFDHTAAGEYELEDILDSCIGHFETKYLIKLIGYPVFESTWVPTSQLANVLDTLIFFLSR